MITCGFGEPTHEVWSVPDALDGLRDAAMWADGIHGTCYALAQTKELDPWESSLANEFMYLAEGIRDEIRRALEVIEANRDAQHDGTRSSHAQAV